jgi:hypothetical protein
MITFQLTNDERTRNIYEELPGCPKPPIITFPEFDYLITSDYSGIQYKKLPKWALKAWWTIIGFRAFYNQLPQRIETLLREREVNGPLNGLVHAGSGALEDDPRNSGPIERAASLILAMYNLYEDIASGNFEPDRHQGQVLEMGHYLNLFSTCFIVENGRPRIFKSTNTSQITVIIDGRFYSLKVGDLRPGTELKQLKGALVDIVQRARRSGARPSSPSPGLLTCANDSTQLMIFSKLQECEINARSLLTLRHSFITLCLDLDSYPSSATEATLAAQSRNCGNRWFHSSFQFVVFGNGSASLISHPGAYLPGDTAIRAAHEIQARALKYYEGREAAGEYAPLPPAQELEWEIDQELIARARRDIELVMDEQQASFEILNIGKSYFDLRNLPAVPVFIVALQMTIKRLTGKMSVIRQFLSMSKYRCMSMTTAVVTTKEVIDFVNYMEKGVVQSERAIMLLRRAVDSQLEECRTVRKYPPFQLVFELFVRSDKKSNKRSRRMRAFVASRVVGLAFKAGLFKYSPVDVVVSHPRIYPKFSILGRPGIRIPYVTDFGLHYQIHDNKIMATVMPSLNWSIPNGDLIAALEESLGQIQTVINNAQTDYTAVNGAMRV